MRTVLMRTVLMRTGRAAADLEQRRLGTVVIPSTTTSATSGAASKTAPSIASLTVTVDDGQPSHPPSSRSRATPPATPRYRTPPSASRGTA